MQSVATISKGKVTLFRQTPKIPCPVRVLNARPIGGLGEILEPIVDPGTQ
jgi:hypothetical protein